MDILPIHGSLDFSNPRSLVSIAPSFVKKALIDIPIQYLEMNEYELEKIVDTNPFINRVRSAFWQEYERAQGEMRQMNGSYIAQTVGTLEAYIKKLFKDEKIAAWILCPPTSYGIFLDEALEFGLKRLRDNVLTLPIVDPETGEVCVKNAELITKVVAFLDMRKNGAVVQKTMNLNVNTTKNDIKDVHSHMSALDLDKKIKELEERSTRVDKSAVGLEVTEAEET